MGSGSSVSSLSQWPSAEWQLDTKNEVTGGNPSFGQPLQQPSLSRAQGLQRYHSAPSTFLQCLADFGEEDFAHITGNNDQVNNFFNENNNLAPIMESAPLTRFVNNKQPIERLTSAEQYLAIQAEKARQPAFRARNNLLRQSSSPAEFLSTEEPTFVFNDAMTAGGGAWKLPTSPAGGKRVRFPEEISDDTTTGLSEPAILMRHQSLPTDGPMHEMGYDDLLDLYAPCKTRARRGYATHPRSIAERNRRSRISERMKKLQDLVPNMDKQTNTADMLDEAVEYVKHLQLQVKDLSETIVRLKNGIRTAG
jgi:hypothetical protein